MEIINKKLATTINIRNAGDSVNLSIKAFNKQSSGLIVKCLEIPHYAY